MNTLHPNLKSAMATPIKVKVKPEQDLTKTLSGAVRGAVSPLGGLSPPTPQRKLSNRHPVTGEKLFDGWE